MSIIASFLRWVLAYLIAIIAAWATINIIGSLFLILMAVTVGFSENEGPLEQALGLSFYLSFYKIAFFTAPALGFVLGAPELFGMKPKVILWTVLGGFASIASSLFILMQDGAFALLHSLAIFNPGSVILIMSAMVGGAVLASLRRSWLR